MSRQKIDFSASSPVASMPRSRRSSWHWNDQNPRNLPEYTESQLAYTNSSFPLVESGTETSNERSLRIAHGAMTTMHATAAHTMCIKRVRTPISRRNITHGTMRRTASNSPSPRVRAANPVRAPMASAQRRAGVDFHLNAAHTVAVVKSAISPSGNSTPSTIHRFG